MIALREVKTVHDGTILINVPPNFGNEVEIILFPSVSHNEIQYWNETEIHSTGKISLKNDFDSEDYSTW
jgi:hypothetical protein